MPIGMPLFRTSVFPEEKVSPRPHHRNSQLLPRHCVYEITESTAAPSVNLRIALKNSLLPSWLVPIVTKWQHRYTRLAGVCFIIAPFASCSILFVPAPLGRTLSVVSFVLQTPLLVLGGLALRTDIIKLLLQTFEFWFFTSANTATNVVMALYYGDLRALYLVPIWFGVQYNICIDAAVRGFKLMIVSLTIGAVYHVLAMARIAFQAIPDVQSFQVLDFGPRSQSANDFLLNTITTVVYMLVRSLYRRGVMLRQASKSTLQTRDVRLVRCICYRRAVKLRPSTNIVLQAEGRLPVSSAKKTPVRIAALNRVFDSDMTIPCGRCVLSHRIPQWLRVALHACGLCGYSLTIIMYFVLSLTPEHSQIARIAAAAAPVLSAPYCVACFVLYNPGLLRHMCFSFDFVFIAAQFLFAHVCAGAVYQWDARALLVLSSFFWAVLMLTVDAFTPVARQKLGFRLRFLVPIVLASIGAHLTIAIQIASRDPSWRLEDYVIFRASAFGREFEVHVMPAFFNRVWMIVFWEWRLLWRILKAPTNGLVMIHGVVDLEISRRRGGSVVGGPELRLESPTMSDRMSEGSAGGGD